MNDLADWLLIGVAALVAGVFNLPVAFKKLQETCKGLLFFEPLRSPGFWLWMTAQLLFPAAIFVLWVTDFFSVKPPIDLMLFMKAIGAGFSFTAFLNARTETAFLTLDIKSIYDRFVRLGFELIATQETRRTKRFFRALDDELRQPHANLLNGLRDLKIYFTVDISLEPEEKQKFLESIEHALASDQIDKQIGIAQILLPEVRHSDLIDSLQSFKLSNEFLRKNLPERISRTISR